MTTSNPQHAQEAFVWVWLPGQTQPVVAGKLVKEQDRYYFSYGRAYRARKDAIALSPIELPLEAGTFEPQGIQEMPSCLRDASMDAWGRRLIQYQFPQFTPNELDYLLLSASDRIGALDFQSSSTNYAARDVSTMDLKDLITFAKMIESGKPLTKPLTDILLHGTSVGGARPKCLMTFNGTPVIAKFSLSTDIYPFLKAEYIAMRLAKHVGIDAASVAFTTLMNRDILLIERFDRTRHTKNSFARQLMLSGLSLLGLSETEARYASYLALADVLRQYSPEPKKSLYELFQRLTFNILIGNTDDHARNHSAFWDGQHLTLTPAYDICPQLRTGHEATQAMAIQGSEGNHATLVNALSVCEHFLINAKTAKAIIQHQMAKVRKYFKPLAAEARLSNAEQQRLLGSVILSDYCLQGW